MRRFILTEWESGSWTIEEMKIESVYPTVQKDSSREMVARLMQLVDVGPTAPQTEPERVEMRET
jgi:hypothetical protein